MYKRKCGVTQTDRTNDGACIGRMANAIRCSLRVFVQSVLLACLLLSLAPANAADAPHPVTYHDAVVDLSVKVWSGSVDIRRTYSEGEWYPNLDWLPLKITYDSFDGSVKTITRSRTEYSKVAPGVYQDPIHNTVRQIATGYRWNNRSNDWIEYNLAGEIKAYGNRNGTIASFQYSGAPSPTPTPGAPASEGHISGILDHFGTQILWLEYGANNRLSSIRDTANRTVTYQWSPTTNGMTLAIKDVNNNNWNYVLSGIGPGAITGSFGTIPADINATTLGTGLNVTDPEGHTTSRRWHTNGTLAIITYPDGSQDHVLQDYDAAKKTFYRREIKAGGKITETWFGLDQDLNRGEFQRKDINGVTVAKQSVDTATRTTTTTDARGLNTAVTRDQWGNITKTVYQDGSSVSDQYEPTYNNLTHHVDENGVITQYSYDAKGNLLKTVEAVGLPEQRTTEYTYDTKDQRISMTRKGDVNTLDAVTHYEYDNNGNVITVTDAENGITRYTYDAMGYALTTTDANGQLWKRNYDKQSQLRSVTDPLNHTSTITYDTAGLPIGFTDAANNVSTLSYDPAGKLLYVVDPYGANTKYTYDAAGNPISITDAENHTQKQEYDLVGRLVKQIDGNNNITQYLYGDVASGLNGLLVKIIYPTRSQEFKYNTRSRITEIVEIPDEATSRVSRKAYDAVGRRISGVDSSNRSTSVRYDALGQITQISDPVGGITQYGYDARGNLISFKDAKGNTHHFEYDKLNRLVKENRPLGQAVTYAYDANSNLIQVADARGQIKQYSYDEAGRRTQENHYLNVVALAAKNAVKSISYSYNALNRLTGYVDGTTVAIYTYDAKQLRLTGESVNFGSFSLVTSTSYNSIGQKSGFTYPDGARYTFTYDTNNQLSTVNFPSGFGSITFNSYLWTAPIQITYPGGTVRNQTFDGFLRFKDFSVKDPGQSQVLNYQYGYDHTDNIVTKATEGGTTSYSYDTLDHLTGATYTNSTQTNEAYTYDQVANRITDHRTSVDWVYNENNQLKTANNLSYAYDDNGNTISQTDSVIPTNTRNYVYDTNNRLIEVRDSSSTLIAAYSYDPFGRRLSKDTGNTRTYYLYNEEGLIAEADATGQVTKSFGYAPGSTFSTNPLWLKTGNAYYTYQNDHLGTPMKLLSQSGSIVWSATYDAFGKAAVDSTSSISNNLRFSGQYYDQESGFHYNWMRYYDPQIGRYITSDPIGLKGGNNSYAYVQSNPVRWVDPIGLYKCIYHVSVHVMVCIPDDHTNPSFVSPFYVAGNNESSSCPKKGCQNNPDAEDVSGSGPIPLGKWAIGPQGNFPGAVSPNARKLTPIDVPNLGKRSGFQTHGCPDMRDCSHGCIAATDNDSRDTFNRLMDLEKNNILQVVK